jgi:hypothetical protein
MLAATVLFAVVALSSGCASLLPTSENATEAPWHSFDEAMRTYNSIVPGKTTTADLKTIGLDPFAQDNITILSYADVLRRFAPPESAIGDIDPEVSDCLKSLEKCTGYEIDQRQTVQNHVGNFWLDFLNFRRVVKTTGWRFTATFVINGDVVVHKAWSGQPATLGVEDTRNPLGPAQSIGSSNFPSIR